MHLTVNDLNKSFGQFQAANNVSFSLEKGKLACLLGPSGSGKTTILRMLAGLEQPDSGTILFGGADVSRLRPQQRGIGFVFQSYALFKHMTVFDNIGFGLAVQKKKKAQIRERVAELLELTGLQGLEQRYPHQLSGGQRQRVAFARALAPEPQMLLLDEPFSAIDALVRKDLRQSLKQMVKRVGITTIFVTHDQEEAMEVADEMLVFHEGRLEQQGTAIELYKYPRSPFVAKFIGESTELSNPASWQGFKIPNEPVLAFVRPEQVVVNRMNEAAVHPAFERGEVKSVEFRGTYWRMEIETKGQIIIGHRSVSQQPLQLGETVQVCVQRLVLVNDQQTWVQDNRLMELSTETIGGKGYGQTAVSR